jgi:signal transduction histidine kinase
LDALAARLPFPLELEIAPVELAGPIEASVYFFCSEALANAAKHAQAQSAHVKIALSDGGLAVQVSDDGSGGADTTAGGLAGLRDRIAALDCTLEVNSPPSGGTTLTAHIPLGL